MLRLGYTSDAAVVTIAFRSKACWEVPVAEATGTASNEAIAKDKKRKKS